jgi:hypothetical protein
LEQKLEFNRLSTELWKVIEANLNPILALKYFGKFDQKVILKIAEGILMEFKIEKSLTGASVQRFRGTKFSGSSCGFLFN